jgi:hypothetical protein
MSTTPADDERVLDRVRKLLAKAEHPGTPPAEAEAFSVKAAELMARHLIDEAMLEAGSATASRPEVRTIEVDPPYALARSVLLSHVAQAHRARVVIRGSAAKAGSRLCTLVGFPADLAATELLFTSLLLQASAAMRAASAGAVNPKAFRRSFLIGYATAIGARLAAVQAEAAADRTTVGGPSTALVLADRDAAVETVFQAEFPRLRTLRTSVSDGHGLAAGRHAGERADLSRDATRLRARGPRAVGGSHP